eukprot:TRINITY_DN311_c0_g1_i3.p1 TRINITY_DN311_c0_g1~~TRINITY_DN311_c0_g1_i3.p1  ORF type:complete len:146 (+),score=35.91 TRINITY_DN311_c0_g1_i3:23-439(+)
MEIAPSHKSSTLPFMREAPDALQAGHQHAEVQGTYRHPVEAIQKNFFQQQLASQEFALRRVYGSHMVQRLQIERHILTQFQRLPVLETSFVGLETVLGTDEDIGFEDYLNMPHMNEHIPRDMHSQMEEKLGITFAKAF